MLIACLFCFWQSWDGVPLVVWDQLEASCSFSPPSVWSLSSKRLMVDVIIDDPVLLKPMFGPSWWVNMEKVDTHLHLASQVTLTFNVVAKRLRCAFNFGVTASALMARAATKRGLLSRGVVAADADAALALPVYQHCGNALAGLAGARAAEARFLKPTK